ncbi:hypothetical protein OG946_17640 [Streptomyces sp. NBC_01808]|uniref:hypothetical protein n=1 Tax=Streptomyces sp. NBC_01808 TaxID=2975947 RepID=UPI002DDAFBEE|nr:hypothetical protein [Streptomyces sp. NBC_01808]WSA42513.1 hypothetical protein OG946_17640 [Streptomyces sp. NBC_01808]
MRCYWDEEDIWFYFEFRADGIVTRQVELQGPMRVPIAAASLDERQQARDAGRLADYEKKYGLTAEPPVSEWEGHDPEPLTAEEFETVWATARRRIAEGSL